MKRTLALLLSILLSFSLFHVLPLTSLAEDTVTEEIDVSPAFGEIENWSGKTWFIVRVSSSSPENHLLFGKLEDGYTLKVTVTDETAGKVYGIEKYFFDTPSLEFGGSSYGTYSGGFLRLAVCEYGIVPVSDHAYTVKLEFLSAEGKVAAQGCSDRGAFDSFNASFQNDGPIVPDPIPHPCTPSGPDTGGAEELIIAPAYGEIENYESHTFFVVNVTSGSADNKDLFGKFKPVGGAEAGAETNARLSLTVTDVLTKKSYVIDDYAFDAPSLEFSAGENSYCGSFLRLDTCKYGVVPQFGHSYTLSLQFYEGDTLIAEGSSAAAPLIGSTTIFSPGARLSPRTPPCSSRKRRAPGSCPRK